MEKSNLMPAFEREAALQWWDKMNLEEKFYKTIKHNNLIVGDKTRHPDTLTGSEIEKIYKEEFKPLK